MKRSFVPALALLLVATTSALDAKQPDLGARSLDVANRALKGRWATVELSDGELFAGARQVYIGPEFTTWEIAGKTHQVATGEVQRIALAKRSSVRKWSRRGLLVGALAGAVGGGYSETDGAFFKPLDASDIARGAATGAALGAAAGAIAGEKIVFEAR